MPLEVPLGCPDGVSSAEGSKGSRPHHLGFFRWPHAPVVAVTPQASTPLGHLTIIIINTPRRMLLGDACCVYGGNRIVVDAFRNMQFGSQFSVSLFFKRTGGERNYQGIVSNGYGSNGAW